MRNLLITATMISILLAISVVSAQTGQPQQIDPLSGYTRGLFAIAPTEDGGNVEECVNYWTTWDHECQGPYHHYEQCVRTYQGGRVYHQTENCFDYGSGWICGETEGTFGCVFTEAVTCEFNSDCPSGEVCVQGKCIKWTRTEGINWFILAGMVIVIIAVVALILRGKLT